MSDFDIKNIKKKIDETHQARKQKVSEIESQTGIPASRDKFLHDLVNSLQTGTQSGAVKKVQMVEHQAKVKEAIKKGQTPPPAPVINENVQSPQQQRPQQPQVNIPPQQQYQPPQQYQQPQYYINQQGQPTDAYGFPITDPQIMAEVERRKAEMMNGGAGRVSPQQINEQLHQQHTSQNVDYLTEQVQKTFENFVNDSLGDVLQEAMKSTIVETYKMERVKRALQENKDIIKGIVLETLRELQKKSNQKKTS